MTPFLARLLLFGIVVFFVAATVGIALARPAPPPPTVFHFPVNAAPGPPIVSGGGSRVQLAPGIDVGPVVSLRPS
ncbi:MAG TPA: hypothetical protein VND54_02985 [Candidatus Saccharimonadales bacterium]|nr:hypothetical protein [Candidatus Saccharimonadales bacterium]